MGVMPMFALIFDMRGGNRNPPRFFFRGFINGVKGHIIGQPFLGQHFGKWPRLTWSCHDPRGQWCPHSHAVWCVQISLLPCSFQKFQGEKSGYFTYPAHAFLGPSLLYSLVQRYSKVPDRMLLYFSRDHFISHMLRNLFIMGKFHGISGSPLGK